VTYRDSLPVRAGQLMSSAHLIPTAPHTSSLGTHVTYQPLRMRRYLQDDSHRTTSFWLIYPQRRGDGTSVRTQIHTGCLVLHEASLDVPGVLASQRGLAQPLPIYKDGLLRCTRYESNGEARGHGRTRCPAAPGMDHAMGTPHRCLGTP
jgi:hypothetical protein